MGSLIGYALDLAVFGLAAADLPVAERPDFAAVEEIAFLPVPLPSTAFAVPPS
jgi:hypothetical protein